MSAWLRALLLTLWLVGLGLLCVYLEVKNVRSGQRVRRLILDQEAVVEKVRRLETRYNRMLSPDHLEKELPLEFRPSEEEEEELAGVPGLRGSTP